MRKTGNEKIVLGGEEIGLSLCDFWSWGYSDLLDNTLRGSYAEFIVAAALGLAASTARVNWEPWDLTLHDENSDIRIEVKSCSYLQAWEQSRPSDIKFGIRPAKSWAAEDGYTGAQSRRSDVYVFCLFAETAVEKADPLELGGWEFYVLPTRCLDECCGAQKTISLSSLLRLNPKKVGFKEIRSAVLQSVRCTGFDGEKSAGI